MNRGIIQTALSKAILLELEYSEPSQSRQDEAARFDEQYQRYNQAQYGDPNEFHQLLAAL
jgi:hypothetical protein